MKKSFTLNDFFLLSHIETDEWLDQEVSMAVFDSRESNSEFGNHGNQFYGIPHSAAVPDKQITANILGYSKALSVIKTSNSGCFNILLN